MECKYICVALHIELQSLHKPEMNWDKCYKQTIETIDSIEGRDQNEEGNVNVKMY